MCLCFVTKLEIWGYGDSSVCKTLAAPSKDLDSGPSSYMVVYYL